jgi:hypothetical protein
MNVLPVSVPQSMDLCNSGSSAGGGSEALIFGNEKYFYLLTHGIGDNEDQDQRTRLVFKSTTNEEVFICREEKEKGSRD